MIYSIDSDSSYRDLLDAIAAGELTDLHLTSNRLMTAEARFILEPKYLQLFKIKFKQYKIVKSADDFKAMLRHIADSEYIAYDTETTGLNVRKDTIIGFAVCGTPGEAWYLPLWEYLPDFCPDAPFNLAQCFTPVYAMTVLKALLNKKLIMHNASYDIRITKSNFGIDLSEALYADTVLMQHTLDEESNFGLKDLAVRFSTELQFDGQDAANQEQLELKENVIAKGGKWLQKCKEMYKGDLAIIGKYCNADVDITLRLFQYLDKRLAEENLVEFFYREEVMPLYTLCTIPMESEGVHLDMEKLKQYNFDVGVELKTIETNVVIAILATDAGQEFVKQRLAEEFPPKNTGAFAQEICKLFDLPLPKLASGKYQITKKTIQLGKAQFNEDENIRGLFQFLEGDPCINLKLEVIEEIQKRLLIAAEGTEHAVNIGSKQQLGKIVFDLMGIKPLSKTEKGAPQFNEAIIDHLVDDHGLEWAKELRVYNKLTKIKGSYFERFLEQQEYGIFYPQFKQHGTTSGRFASDLQQLSRPLDEESGEDPRIIYYTNILRKLFIAKEGYAFIDDDYESLEPRVFADDAEDDALLKIFTDNLDMYSVVAIGAEKLEGVSADKKSPNFLKNLMPEKRQNAKAYALGIRYGLKDFKLSKMLNIEPSEAQTIIDNYFIAFPGLKKAMNKYLKEVKSTGRVTSKFGRVRHLPRVKEIKNQFGDDILDFKKLINIAKTKYQPLSELKVIRKEYNNLLNNALNFPIQSAGASLINRAMIAMTLKFKDQNLDAWVSLQLHDQAVVSCREDQVEIVMKIVQDCMENTNKLRMPLIAKPEKAYNLADGH